MAGITLAQAEAKLATWLTAEDEVAANQSYAIGNRTLTRADLEFVRETVSYWNNMCKKLSRGGIRVRGITPR